MTRPSGPGDDEPTEWIGQQSGQAGARGNRQVGWPTAAAGVDPPTEHFAPQSHAPQSHGQPQAVQPQASLAGRAHGGVDKQFG